MILLHHRLGFCLSIKYQISLKTSFPSRGRWWGGGEGVEGSDGIFLKDNPCCEALVAPASDVCRHLLLGLMLALGGGGGGRLSASAHLQNINVRSTDAERELIAKRVNSLSTFLIRSVTKRFRRHVKMFNSDHHHSSRASRGGLTGSLPSHHPAALRLLSTGWRCRAAADPS